MATPTYGDYDLQQQRLARERGYLPRDYVWPYDATSRLTGIRQGGYKGPVFDATTGAWISGSGQPFRTYETALAASAATPSTGAAGPAGPGGPFSTAASGTTPAGGAAATLDPNANFPKLVTTVQQPEVKNIAANLLKQQPQAAKESQSAFATYKQQLDAAKAKATATGDQFGKAGQAEIARTEQAIKDFKATSEATRAAELAALRGRNVAANAATNQAMQTAIRLTRAGQAGLGPARSQAASGALSSRYANIAASHLLPEAVRQAEAYQQWVSGGRGVAREYLGNEQAQARFNLEVARQARQMNTDEAFRWLTVENEIPFISQRLRAGEITIAQALQALERSAVDFTYVQPYDPSRIPPTGSYSPVLPSPGRPNPQNPYQSPDWSPLGTGPSPAAADDWYARQGLPNPSDPNNWYKQRGLPTPPLPSTVSPTMDWSGAYERGRTPLEQQRYDILSNYYDTGALPTTPRRYVPAPAVPGVGGGYIESEGEFTPFGDYRGY